MSLIDLRRGPSDELDEIAETDIALDDESSLDPLIERIATARAVLLGEASHGTSDYYRWRAAITRRLVAEHGFSFVAVEGDWPDCFAVNRWVKGRADQPLASTDVLNRFERWPTWMWANHDVAEFIAWLREHNLRTASDVGFFGLDVYSLWESLHRVIGYLGEHQPDALEAALDAFQCFEPYREDPQEYAWATRMVPATCENEVVDLLRELHRTPLVVDDDPEAELDALQNAEVLAGAERYYRTMIGGGNESWNVRDCHMVDTLDRLLAHHGPGAKGIVWEHNTHVGDARATDMAAAGMLNVGQVVRERHGRDNVALVGFGGHHGSVVAAHSWGGAMHRMTVPSAPDGTHEDLLHRTVAKPTLFVFPDDRATPWLSSRRGHRAIGVVYQPEGERRGNWVPTVLGQRYDAFLSFDAAEALHPLHRG